jgi:hypothetical protein
MKKNRTIKPAKSRIKMIPVTLPMASNKFTAETPPVSTSQTSGYLHYSPKSQPELPGEFAKQELKTEAGSGKDPGQGPDSTGRLPPKWQPLVPSTPSGASSLPKSARSAAWNP